MTLINQSNTYSAVRRKTASMDTEEVSFILSLCHLPNILQSGNTRNENTTHYL